MLITPTGTGRRSAFNFHVSQSDRQSYRRERLAANALVLCVLLVWATAIGLHVACFVLNGAF